MVSWGHTLTPVVRMVDLFLRCPSSLALTLLLLYFVIREASKKYRYLTSRSPEIPWYWMSASRNRKHFLDTYITLFTERTCIVKIQSYYSIQNHKMLHFTGHVRMNKSSKYELCRKSFRSEQDKRQIEIWSIIIFQQNTPGIQCICSIDAPVALFRSKTRFNGTP